MRAATRATTSAVTGRCTRGSVHQPPRAPTPAGSTVLPRGRRARLRSRARLAAALRRARAPLSGSPQARAPRLGGGSRRVRGRRRRARVGSRRGLERGAVPRLLPRRRRSSPLRSSEQDRSCSSAARWAAPVALVYSGVAIGVAVAVPLEGSLAGADVPEAQDVLELWPARVLAIAGNSLGTLAVVVVAVATIRRRPLGNALLLAGVGVAAVGSGLAGLGVGALAPILVAAALLLYAGFVAPTRLVLVPKPRRALRRVAGPPLPDPDRDEHATRSRSRSATRRSLPRRRRARWWLALREEPHPTDRVEDHQAEHRVLGA